MIGTLDSQVIEKFKEFQEKTGKYNDLDIESIKLENISLSNNLYFEFIKGKNKYIQRYIKKHPGEYPILGSSLKNECISDYIQPIDMSDVIDKPCVSFNKDNAKGSVPFYRDYPFLMDRHHIAILCSDNIFPQYLYYSLIRYFEKSKFGWGENVASVEEVYKHFVPVPIDLNEQYNSINIQEAIVEFLEFWKINYTDIFRQTVIHQNPILEKIKKALIPATLRYDKTVLNSFNEFASDKGSNFKLDEIEFENSTLGNVIVLNGGDRITKKNNSGTIYPVYGGGDVSFKTDTYNRENEYVIGRFAISETCVRFVNKKFHLLDSGFTFNIKNNFEGMLDKNFIGYFLLSIQHKIYACAKGSGQKNLDTKLFNKIEFSFPKDQNIQSLLVEFWEMILNNIDERFTKFNNIERLTDKVDEAFLYRTFSKIEWREE